MLTKGPISSGFCELTNRIFQSVSRELIPCVDLQKFLAAFRHFGVISFLCDYPLIPFPLLLKLEDVEPVLRSRLEECDCAGQGTADHCSGDHEPSTVGHSSTPG